MIEVLYTCDTCGIKDAKVPVQERGESEDIKHWIEAVMAVAISQDHQHKSPFCQATSMTQVKIPLPPGHSRIGDPIKH